MNRDFVVKAFVGGKEIASAQVKAESAGIALQLAKAIAKALLGIAAVIFLMFWAYTYRKQPGAASCKGSEAARFGALTLENLAEGTYQVTRGPGNSTTIAPATPLLIEQFQHGYNEGYARAEFDHAAPASRKRAASKPATEHEYPPTPTIGHSCDHGGTVRFSKETNSYECDPPADEVSCKAVGGTWEGQLSTTGMFPNLLGNRSDAQSGAITLPEIHFCQMPSENMIQ
jgi:hypothetical protein